MDSVMKELGEMPPRIFGLEPPLHDTRTDIVGRHCQPTLSAADIVHSVMGTDKRKIFRLSADNIGLCVTGTDNVGRQKKQYFIRNIARNSAQSSFASSWMRAVEKPSV